jgi:hypothetical protein
MTDYEKDIPAIVKAIIDGPYTAFGGAALKDVISFTVMDQYSTNSDANRLEAGAGPEASTTRVLFAAATTVFARAPEKYGELKLQQLILDHVNQIRTAGVRGSETTVGTQLGTLDEEDKAAGKTLFQMLKHTIGQKRSN